MSTESNERVPSWDPEAVLNLVTADRMAPYLAVSSQNLGGAFRLYEWNTRGAAAAIMQTMAMVEVVVRNALDIELRAWADRNGTSSWLDRLPLDDRGRGTFGKPVGERPGTA